MNSRVHMKIDLLGNIYIKDTIIYYDQPLVFLGINDFENHFIASCTDIEDTHADWIFLPISKSKSIKALNGNILAYDLFKEPEGDILWKVRVDNNSNGVARLILPEDIPDDDLPEKDIVYDIYENQFLPSKEEIKIVDAAIEERRDIIDISLENKNSHEHEISAELLADIIKENQKIINLISHSNSVNYKIPNEIKQKNKLNVSGFFAASFGVRMKSANLINLEEILGESELQKSINILMNILESKGNTSIIKNIFKTLNPNVTTRYINMLKILNKGDVGIKVSYGSPNNTHRSVALNTMEVSESLKCIENNIETLEHETNIKGTLVGINITDYKFEILTGEKIIIKGDIDKNIDIPEYKLPKEVSAKLKTITKLEKLNNKEQVIYRLIELEYID